jgi:hypothetical protein
MWIAYKDLRSDVVMRYECTCTRHTTSLSPRPRHTCSNQLGYLKSIYDKLLNFKNYIIGVYSAVSINMIKENPRWLGKKRCLLQA